MNPELHMKLRSTGDRPCASSRATRNDAAIQMTQTRAMKKYPSAAPEGRERRVGERSRVFDALGGFWARAAPGRGHAGARREARESAVDAVERGAEPSTARNRSEYRITNARANERWCVGANR